MSILILSGRVDKWHFHLRRRPVIAPRIHDADRLAQFAEDSFAKTEEPETSPPQQQSMLPPNHHTRPGHKHPVPPMNQPDETPWPISPQNRQPLALKPDVLHLILEDLIAQSSNRR